MSRADQSLTNTTPNTWGSASSTAMGEPSALPDAHDEADLGLDVQLTRRHALDRVPLADQAGRPPNGGARHDDGRCPTVVADGQVSPVRQQRLTARSEDVTEVRRVLERRVEVDVVADVDRPAQPDPVDARQRGHHGLVPEVVDQAFPGAAPLVGAGGQELVE